VNGPFMTSKCQCVSMSILMRVFPPQWAWRLSRRSLREGDLNAAAQRLDGLLCDDILPLNSELPYAEGADRAFIKSAFAVISRVRPTCAALLAETRQQPNGDHVEAERILAGAAKQVLPGKGSVAVLP
jgi:hypothetical protein